MRIARLDRFAVGVARSVRPHVVLVLHVVCSPPAALVRAFSRTPVALYVHADELVDRVALTRFALRTADRIIAVSDHTQGIALRLGADPRRVRRISPGVDLPGPAVAEREVRPTIITVARLVKRYKGHDVMVRALARLRDRVPDVRWVVLGDGPLRGELEVLVAAEGVEDLVTFAGAVSDPERDAWLDRAHVFAMPSRLPSGRGGEGFGIVYTEAAAHGLPVVAGDVGGATDAVRHGQTGLLVDPTDPAAVADALARILLDPALAARLGQSGRVHARELAWPRVAGRVEDALLELIAQ
jgi:phosphatidylinositol alpha-1,6-mannosyltransferase